MIEDESDPSTPPASERLIKAATEMGGGILVFCGGAAWFALVLWDHFVQPAPDSAFAIAGVYMTVGVAMFLLHQYGGSKDVDGTDTDVDADETEVSR